MYSNSKQNQYLLRRFLEQVAPRLILPKDDKLGHRSIATGCDIYLPFPYESEEFSDAVKGVDLITPVQVPPGPDPPPPGSGSSESSSSSSSSGSGSSEGSDSSSGSDGSSSGSGSDSGGGSDSGSGGGSDSGSGSGSTEPPIYLCSDPGPISCKAAIELLAPNPNIFFECPPTTVENQLCYSTMEVCPPIEDPCPAPTMVEYFCCYADGSLRTVQVAADCACECCVTEFGIECPCPT